MSQLEKYHTPCKNCIFAEYKGKTQHGCQMGRIEPFRDLGSIIEAEDEEKEFFIVNGRFCNAYSLPDGEFAKKTKPEDRVAVVKAALALKLTFIVIMGDGATPQSIEPTISAILAQTVKPCEVIFVNNQTVVPAPLFHTKIFKMLGNDVTWRLTHIVEREADGSFVSWERCVDHAMNNVNGAYYSVFTAGYAPPSNFVAKLDESLSNRMERFSLLTPGPNGEGLTVQTSVHKSSLISGNTKMVAGVEGEEPVALNNVVDKIKFYAKVQDMEYLVKNVAEICPCL